MKRFIFPVCLTLITTFFAALIIPSSCNTPIAGKYHEGRWVCDDGTVLKLSFILDPGLSIELRPPDCLIMPYEKYPELTEGRPIVKATKYICISNDTGDVHIIMLVEPKLIIIEHPISGSLAPGYFHRYGKFCSCVQIEVEMTWTPSDQVLGIGIVDADTGEGIVRWYTGGSAVAVFTTDWMKCYYIAIISYMYNTKTINYSGIIRAYVW
ncbi:hypothetical protein KEJ48_03460 [Candidatus Bathyarchaeota archaeon]|nr:hypothetical protein [Candidatus Bathyarchaeota archaeon]